MTSIISLVGSRLSPEDAGANSRAELRIEFLLLSYNMDQRYPQRQSLQTHLHKTITDPSYTFSLPDSRLDLKSLSSRRFPAIINSETEALSQLHHFVGETLRERYPDFFQEEIEVRHFSCSPNPIFSSGVF